MIRRFKGHVDEILCLKQVLFDGKLYLLSSSKDGQMMKWHINPEDYRYNYVIMTHFNREHKLIHLSSLISQSIIADNGTQVVGFFDFLPNCGNKLFIAACDGGLKIIEFETEQVSKFPSFHLHSLSSS